MHSHPVVFNSWCSAEYSLSGSPVHGIFQARILKWIAISYSRVSFWTRNGTCICSVSCIAGIFFTTNTAWEALGINGLCIFWLRNICIHTCKHTWDIYIYISSSWSYRKDGKFSGIILFLHALVLWNGNIHIHILWQYISSFGKGETEREIAGENK